jgi:hypothetical protein
MRRALIRSFSSAALAFALLARPAEAAEPRPIVRVVLLGGATPPWFDGFAKHLESELALRGIDVEVARAPSVPGGVDAELVVETPSALRPVLRFTVAPSAGATRYDGDAGHVRQVNLGGVPSDGCALALAVAADELMRSTWLRAVPTQNTGNGAGARGSAEGRSAEDGRKVEEGRKPEDRKSKDRKVDEARDAEDTRGAEDAHAVVEADTVGARGAERAPLFAIRAAAATEVFTGGQMQIGADVRWAVRPLARLEVELRGGWRTIVRREGSHGSIDGTAIVGGGALAFRVSESARTALLIVGRADLVRSSYVGKARDGSIDATDDSVFGLVLGVGPRGRLALSRAVAIEGEILAGASPIATTATDTDVAVLSTNGAAFMASLGLSFGL